MDIPQYSDMCLLPPFLVLENEASIHDDNCPNVANFAKDYEVLDYSGASQPLPDDASSVPALVDFVVQSQTTQANVGALVEDAKAALKPLVKDLIVMIRAGA